MADLVRACFELVPINSFVEPSQDVGCVSIVCSTTGPGSNAPHDPRNLVLWLVFRKYPTGPHPCNRAVGTSLSHTEFLTESRTLRGSHQNNNSSNTCHRASRQLHSHLSYSAPACRRRWHITDQRVREGTCPLSPLHRVLIPHTPLIIVTSGSVDYFFRHVFAQIKLTASRSFRYYVT